MNKLGKGLQSLIPPKQTPGEINYPKSSSDLQRKRESIFDIEVNKIKSNPYQPRYEMEQSSLRDLAESIKQHGILQPLIVTKTVKETERGQGVEYQIVAGHRRLEAAKIAGLAFVPSIIRDSTEQQKLELALVENIQRTDLNCLERAAAFKRLIDEFDLTHEEVGQKVGKSREFVSNSVRLLGLPDFIQTAVRQGRVSEGHARAILSIKNPAGQKALFDEIVTNSLSVRQAEQRTREVYVQSHKRRVMFDPEVKEILIKLEASLGTKVKIRKSGVGGNLMIQFESKSDLEKIVKKIIN